MQQIHAAIVLLIVIIFIFIPSMGLKEVHDSNQDIKQALNLSTRVIGNCVDRSKINFTELARGYNRDSHIPIEVDRERLMKEFYQLMSKNLTSERKFQSVKDKLLVKVVVYYDQFFVADKKDSWSAPYFFTWDSGNELIYLNTQDDTVSYYDASGYRRNDRTITYYGLNREQKNDQIIKQLNAVVAQYTSEKLIRKNGLKIEIQNSARSDLGLKLNKSFFNVLDGVTFFVIYAENPSMVVNSKDVKYRNYNVVGYTVE
ncbi:MAG: hypothetical protein K0R31_206 [Clostridiales bacterium]|jgi:hypothetical protein|nr:hypothetical protein [Clostridiales bacterium]